MKLTDSRRWTGRFLTALAILVLVFSSGLNQSALAQDGQSLERQDCNGEGFLWDNSIAADQSWVTPPVLQAQDGTSDFTVNLTAEVVKKTVDTLFQECPLQSYKFSCGENCTEITDERWNDNIQVGPTIKVKPGQTLNVNLQNKLMDLTNLHTHGLHISPKGNSDNVLLEIGNGESQNYTFKIDENHYPGTFWYHPHVHGTTATQVEDGMAGALIVEDESAPKEWIEKARDRIFVLQEIPEVNNTTINGVLSPRMDMDLGALERWRFIHAGETDSIVLNFSSLIDRGFRFKLIALDGITLHYSRELLNEDELKLYPGYRADVIVKAPLTQSQLQGKSSLTNNRQKVVRLFRKYNPSLPASILGKDEGDEDLVTVELTEENSAEDDIDLPDNDVVLRDPTEEGLLHDIEIAEVTNTEDPREVNFNFFNINGKTYPAPQDPTKEFCLKQGDAEYWELTSSASAHPFHIHVNAFQVVNPGDSGTTEGDWHDTIIVNRTRYDENGEPINPVIIKTRYDDFDGPFVLHCHILHHEDEGMMSLVEITNNEDGNCNNLSSTSED